jgi:hypothetical protein
MDKLLSLRFPTVDAAFAAIEAEGADKTAFKAIPDQGEFILIARESAKESAESAQKGPAKGKGKGKGKGGRKSVAIRVAEAVAKLEKGKADRKAAADLAKAQAEKAANPNSAKDMHYSAETLPSKEDIETGLKGMQPAMRDHFKAALGGKLPEYDVFKLSKKEKDKEGQEIMETEETHRPSRTRRDELYAIRNKGRRDAESALKEALAWRDGKGTRMTCSSTIPLGRFHQQLILALKAKIANKRKAAKKANREAPAAMPPEQPQAQA